MQICCTNDNSVIIINFLTIESYKKLLKAKCSLVHLGLMVFSITWLHRLGLGIQLALSLVDTRQINNMTKAIIGTAEIDMRNNFEVIYMIPVFLETIDTLYENIKLAIKSRGHNMINTKQNILLTKLFIGQSKRKSNKIS